MLEGAQAPLVSVVIPTYRPGPRLPDVIRRVLDALERRRLEIILVDDGNDPAVAAHIRAAASSVPNCRLVHLERNQGQQRATLAGIRRARGRFIVTLDDDGGHPPELLPRMLTALGLPATKDDRMSRGAARPPDGAARPRHDGLSSLKPADLVYGVPARASSRPRALGSWLNRWIFRVFLGVSRCTAVTSFRAFRAELLAAPHHVQAARLRSARASWNAKRPPVRARRIAESGPPRSPNLSAMLLARAPRVQCVSFEPPRSHLTRHSSLSLARALTVLALYWAPRGLLIRALAQRERPR